MAQKNCCGNLWRNRVGSRIRDIARLLIKKGQPLVEWRHCYMLVCLHSVQPGTRVLLPKHRPLTTIKGAQMDKERLKQLAEDPRFIQSIYNYCDRWCERCPFTARCLNFALGEEGFDHLEVQDLDNEAFWKKLSETLQVTLELLEEAAEENGIDLHSLNAEELGEEERSNDELARDHECSRTAKLYIEMVDDWLNSARDLFGEEEKEIAHDQLHEAVDTDSSEKDTGLLEPAEVVDWYQHLIYVKLMRAIRGELDEEPDFVDEYPKDSDGSAKVALIGIDRSIAAWGEIRNCFPHRSDQIMDILLHLEQLRRNVEKTFPNARAFIRPGFDRIDLNS